jgi:hypothetical protein
VYFNGHDSPGTGFPRSQDGRRWPRQATSEGPSPGPAQPADPRGL